MKKKWKKKPQPPPKTETERSDEWKINDDDYQKHQTTTHSNFRTLFRMKLIEIGFFRQPSHQPQPFIELFNIEPFIF